MLSIPCKSKATAQKRIASKSSGSEIKKVAGRRRDRRHTSQRHERLRGMPRGSRDARIALVPCGHQRFCEACANEVERQGRGCPICHTDIQMILRLF